MAETTAEFETPSYVSETECTLACIYIWENDKNWNITISAMILRELEKRDLKLLGKDIGFSRVSSSARCGGIKAATHRSHFWVFSDFCEIIQTFSITLFCHILVW